MPKRSWRLSAFIDDGLGQRMYALAQERGCSITGIVEAALAEYLAARPEGTTLPLAPRLAKAPGRPSQIALAAGAQLEERMRKKTGRPLKPRESACTAT